MNKLLLSSFLIFLLGISSLYAQKEKIYWNYDISHGLPTNSLYHVMVDHSGRVWFGSDYGVTCYDGIEFKTYTVNEGLLDNTVIRCYEDSLHRIWFQHVNQVPTYFRNGKIHQINEGDQKLEIPTGSFFVETSKGNLIITANNKAGINGLLNITPSGQINFTPAQKNNTLGHTLCWKNNTIMQAVNDPTEKEFRVGKYRIKNVMYELREYYTDINLDYASFGRSYADMRPSDVALVKGLELEKVYHIIIKNNQKVFSTSNGLFVFKKEKGKWVFQNHHLKTKIIVSSDVDQNGNIWSTSLNSGLYFIPKISYSSVELQSDQRCVYTYEKDGVIYTGGENLIISYVDIDQINDVKIPQFDNELLRQYSSSLAIYDKRFVYSNGLDWFIYNIETQSTQKVKTNAKSTGHPFIYEGNSSELYPYGFNGIGVINLNDENPTNTTISKSIGRVKSVIKHKNTLFIGTQNGMFCYSQNKITPFYDKIFKNSRINTMVLLGDFIFIATADKGIWAFHSKEKRLIHYTEPLLSNVIKGIYKVDDSAIWVHTNLGLQKLRFQNENLTELDRLDIRTKLKINDLINVHEKNGKLIIATDKTFFFIPLNFQFKPKSIPFKLESFSSNGKDIRWTKGLNLKDNQNNLIINTVCVNHTSHPVEFFYRLNNGPWLQNSSSSFSFSSLSSGNYQLELKAVSPYYLTSQINNISFSIQKKWFERLPIVIISILVPLVLLLLFIRWRVNKTQIRKRQILSTELISLQSQMNPHFTFNSLNSIQSYLSNNDKRAAQIYLADFAILMRKILDQAKLGLISIEEEISFLKQYLSLEQRRLNNSFEFNFIVDEEILRKKLAIPTLMLQPFVENAIWHGVAALDYPGQIDVTFSENDINIICEIKDNGPGLSAKNVKRPQHKSTGIKNCEERMNLFRELHKKEIYFVILDRKENNEHGVCVRLTIPKISL